MEYKVKNSSLIGISAVIVLGTLLHFLYAFTGKSPVAALISPINESVWEHLKMLFYPALILLIIEYFIYGKNYPNFLFSKTMGILTGLVFIPVFYYLYTGVLGSHYLIIDVLLFVAAVILSYLVSDRLMASGVCKGKTAAVLSGVILLLLIILFSVFTFNPPVGCELFQNPQFEK